MNLNLTENEKQRIKILGFSEKSIADMVKSIVILDGDRYRREGIAHVILIILEDVKNYWEKRGIENDES
jgi:hypothetical protein